MKQDILELIKNKPRNYAVMIKKSPELLQWVMDNTLVKSNRLPEMVYSAIYQISNRCEYGNIRTFNNVITGYKGCGRATTCKCVKEIMSDKISKARLNFTPEQKKDMIQKQKETCLERYGVDSKQKLEENTNQGRRTKLDRYGDANYTNRDKAKNTMLKKYGVEHYSKTDEYKQRFKDTNLERYGVEHYSKTDECKTKMQDTCLERYGVITNLILESTKLQIKKTKFKKYGDENYNNKDKHIQTTLDRYGVEYYNQISIPKESLIKLNSKEWLVNQHHNHEKSQSEIAKNINVGIGTIYTYLKKYNIEIKYYSYSHPEKELGEYISETYNTKVITNSRKIIPPYELDIYLPEHNLAIEYNGVYWHRPEKFGSKLQWFLYHQNKEELCNLQGIQLLHLWENYGDHNDLIDKAINGYVDNDLEKIYEEIFMKKKHSL